jgi:galactose mutarotase-like enzyme
MGAAPLVALALTDGDATATVVPARGGLVSRFSVAGDELLYLDEATLLDVGKNVRGGIPVLFPFSGRLPGDSYAVDGARYSLPQHGFGRNKAWNVVDTSLSRVVMALEDDEATRASYPFRFRAELAIAVADGWLDVRLSVSNPGDRPLPVAPGWHPYFLLADAAKGEARVLTDATRARDNRTGQELAIDGPIDLTTPEVDLHLADHRDRRAPLVRPGKPSVIVEFNPGVLVVWTLAGRDFVCVEPWDGPAGSFPDRCRRIAPGETQEVSMRIGRASA